MRADPVRNHPEVQPVGEADGPSSITLRNRTARPGNEPGTETEQPQRLARTVNGPTVRTEGDRRTRWSRQDNLDLMRAYYLATNLEMDRTNYRHRLAEIWEGLRPDFPRNPQQLTDQVRSVVRRQALSEAELHRLREEIEGRNQENVQQQADALPTRHIQEQRRSRISLANRITVEVSVEQVSNAYVSNDIKFRGMPMSDRPAISKISYNSRTKATVQCMNSILSEHITDEEDLESLCHKIYCAAVTVCEQTGLIIKTTSPGNKINENPPWKKRLENKIGEFRKTIGILQSYLNQPPTGKTTKKVKFIARRANIQFGNPDFQRQLRGYLDSLKQKIAALGCRIRRYNERTKRYQQNRLFNKNPAKFYRTLDKDPDAVGEPPS